MASGRFEVCGSNSPTDARAPALPPSPFRLLGCLALAAAFLTLGLPETLGESAPATIQELHLQMSIRRKRHSWRHALAGVASVLRPGSSPPSRTASATLETSAPNSARATSP